MLRSVNAATPKTALTVNVPDSTPVPGGGFVPIAMLTGPVNPVATLPKASNAVTMTPPVLPSIVEPAVVSLG